MGQARLPALLIATVVVAAVCVAATWPRWHPVTPLTPLAIATPPLPQNTAAPAGATSGPAVTTAGAAGGASSALAAQRDANAASAPMPTSASNVSMTHLAAPGSVPPEGKPGTVSGAPGTASPLLSPAPLAANAIADNGPDNPPNWNRLNDAQHAALGPFAAQWDKFSDQQKRKWLAIAAVFPRMSPGAQQRLHARMLRWTQMTPEERMLARENYELSRVLPPSARQQAWLAYEALPPAQKAKLAAAEKLHRRRLVVSALPNAHVNAHARRGTQKNGGRDDPHALTLEPLIPLGTPGATSPSAASSTVGTAVPTAPAAASNSAAPQREASAGAGMLTPAETAGDGKP